jgi:hypothetical protein
MVRPASHLLSIWHLLACNNVKLLGGYSPCL